MRIVRTEAGRKVVSRSVIEIAAPTQDLMEVSTLLGVSGSRRISSALEDGMLQSDGVPAILKVWLHLMADPSAHRAQSHPHVGTMRGTVPAEISIRRVSRQSRWVIRRGTIVFQRPCRRVGQGTGASRMISDAFGQIYCVRRGPLALCARRLHNTGFFEFVFWHFRADGRFLVSEARGASAAATSSATGPFPSRLLGMSGAALM